MHNKSETFKIKNTTDSIRKRLQKVNYYLQNEYKNNHSKLQICCDKNHIFCLSLLEIMRLSRKMTKKFCPICLKKFLGKKSLDLFVWQYGNEKGPVMHEKYIKSRKTACSLEK